MMKTEKSIVVDAPVEQVFAYVVDPAREPEYMSGTNEVKDIQRLPDGRYTYTNVSKFLGLPVDFKTEQTEVIPNERILQKGHGAGMDSAVSIRFERLDDNKTRVSTIGETNLHAGPFSRFGEASLEKYFDHSVDATMEAAKVHIEAETRTAMPG